MNMNEDLEELQGDVDFDFFDDPPKSAKHVRSPSPRDSSKVVSKPPPAPKSPNPDSPVNNRESRWILDSEYDRVAAGSDKVSGRGMTTAKRTADSEEGKYSQSDESYSSDSDHSDSETDDSSSFSNVSSVRSGGRARNESRSKLRSISRSPSPPPTQDSKPKSIQQKRPQSGRPMQRADARRGSGKRNARDSSSDSKSEADSCSESDRSSSQTPRDKKKGKRQDALNSYDNESKTSTKARPFSAHPRRRQNGVSYQAWDNEEEENNRDASKRKNNKGKSIRHQHYDDDDRSHSDSDMTDVSPLTSPRNSPHKRKNDSRNYDSVPNASRGKTVQYREIPEDSCSNQRLSRGETETLDLNILMKAVSELEKKKRVKDNTRHVMFAPPKAQDRSNFTFTSDRTKRIEQENQRLLQQIMKHVAEQREPHRVHLVEPAPVRRVTASAINRQKQQRKIESDNMQLLKRLQKIQPSRGMSRDEQITKYKQTMLYGVPVANEAASTRLRRSRPGSAGSTFSQRSRTSVQSVSTSASQMSTTRSGRPRSRPGSAYQVVDLRPSWSDRW